MKPLNPLGIASFDIKTMSQEERTLFYREAIRSAHAARSEAVREMFQAVLARFERHPLLTRALVDSAAVIAIVIAFGVTEFETASARVADVSIGHVVSGLPLLW